MAQFCKLIYQTTLVVVARVKQHRS